MWKIERDETKMVINNKNKKDFAHMRETCMQAKSHTNKYIQGH